MSCRWLNSRYVYTCIHMPKKLLAVAINKALPDFNLYFLDRYLIVKPQATLAHGLDPHCSCDYVSLCFIVGS